MPNFWDNLESFGDAVALMAEGEAVRYRELAQTADLIAREIPERSLVFLLCKNQVDAVAGYLGCLRKRIVPVLLSAAVDPGLFGNLLELYRPQYVWCPEDFPAGTGAFRCGGYQLVETGQERPEMNPGLALLVSTSGSTGSPKLVRLSYGNLQANTESIVSFLGIVPEDRAITSLPMHYVYGLSILQTHLMAGAGIILTEKSVFDGPFWELFKRYGATTFSAVPYIYQKLDQLHFLNMDLPSLRYITQAGGSLGKDLHEKIGRALEKQGKSLIVMYGASEATARMSYVPASRTVEKAGSIGVAIPGGRFELIDRDGNVITENGTAGELVYYGENVMWGYAKCRDDLKKGDEMNGRLPTGDLSTRDDDGFYHIVGRKNRFVKVLGNRVNLGEIEEILTQAGFEVACVGEEDRIRIYTTSDECPAIVAFISRKTGLNPMAFTAIRTPRIPRNQAGKVLYAEL